MIGEVSLVKQSFVYCEVTVYQSNVGSVLLRKFRFGFDLRSCVSISDTFWMLRNSTPQRCSRSRFRLLNLQSFIFGCIIFFLSQGFFSDSCNSWRRHSNRILSKSKRPRIGKSFWYRFLKKIWRKSPRLKAQYRYITFTTAQGDSDVTWIPSKTSHHSFCVSLFGTSGGTSNIRPSLLPVVIHR